MPTVADLGIFLQARMGSSRLPGKIFKPIGGKPGLEILCDNLKRTPFAGHLVLVTSDNPLDDRVAEFAAQQRWRCFRGSENDVLARFVEAGHHFGVRDIVRLTGDCPFLSMEILVRNIAAFYEHKRPDYYFVEGYPAGLGAVEVMRLSALDVALCETHSPYDREHVMPYLVDHPEKFRVVIEQAPPELFQPDLHLTLDTPEDLERLDILFRELLGRVELRDLLEVHKRRPALFSS
jgi:spore coat polysaccharide biosynthesis protein SpsF